MLYLRTRVVTEKLTRRRLQLLLMEEYRSSIAHSRHITVSVCNASFCNSVSSTEETSVPSLRRWYIRSQVQNPLNTHLSTYLPITNNAVGLQLL